MKVCCKQGSDTWFTSIDLNTNHIYVESVNSIGEQKNSDRDYSFRDQES